MKVCSDEGCGKVAMARGMCGVHYGRWWRLENAQMIQERYKQPCVVCKVPCWSGERCMDCYSMGRRTQFKSGPWEHQKLGDTHYFRRDYGPLVLRVYAGESVNWEIENTKNNKVWGGKVRSDVEARRKTAYRASQIVRSWASK